MSAAYRNDIDVLKGFAIIAVVFYHLGILKSGYLAVDLFFVISGYLTIPSVCRHIHRGDFSYIGFIKKKLIRFLPLVLIASVFCLTAGAIGMLPDHYENLAQSVIASNFLSGNILSSLTSKNYWNALNDYKPLMHVWYLGVLFEFYVVFPLLILGFRKFLKRKGKDLSEQAYEQCVNRFLILLCAVSVLCYLNPFTFGINPHTAEGIRFYWLQNRFFELGLGGLAGLNIARMNWLNRFKWISPVTILGLLAVICISLVTFDIHSIGSHLPVIGAPIEYGTGLILPPAVLLIMTVILSCLVVAQDNTKNPVIRYIFSRRPLAAIGRMSLSIFVWHQIIIAFYRYYMTNEISVLFLIIYLAAVLAISFVTWRFVEEKTNIYKGSPKPLASKVIWSAIGITEILTCAAAFALYLNAGVIRDVPELDIKQTEVHRSMHAEYCDRIYKYNHDFSGTGDRIRVLVIGNSFARDWGNILLESEMKDRIELSYIYTDYKLTELNEKKHVSRIQQSDYIFVFAAKPGVPEYLWQNAKNPDRVYGIGTKNFGQSNGTIYRHRRDADYFEQTIPANPEYDNLNARWKSEWGAHYLDFIEKVRVPQNRIRVFSDDHKFISQDCEHLTRGGAQFYAHAFDIPGLFR